MKTPIEKAAELIESVNAVRENQDGFLDAIEMADIIQEEISEEVPKRTGKAADLSAYSVGYDKARKDIGLEE